MIMMLYTIQYVSSWTSVGSSMKLKGCNIMRLFGLMSQVKARLLPSQCSAQAPRGPHFVHSQSPCFRGHLHRSINVCEGNCTDHGPVTNIPQGRAAAFTDAIHSLSQSNSAEFEHQFLLVAGAVIFPIQPSAV